MPGRKEDGLCMNEKSLEVLELYDFTVLQAQKGRGAMVILSDHGMKLLMEYRGSGRHIEWCAPILDGVNDKGSMFTDSYEKNREGSYVSVAADRQKYVVKRWCGFRECDSKNLSDVVRAIRTLALFHKETESLIPDEKLYKGASIKQDMERHTDEIARVAKYLAKRSNRKGFETLALKGCENFLEEAKDALLVLSESCWGEGAQMGICHGCFTYHNVGFGELPIMTDFEKLNYGHYMCDLYHILRKILEKNDWDMKLGYKLISEYDSVNSITDADLKLLTALFSYPEKFWKLINAYFNSRKIWIPEKNYEKLKKVIEQNQKRREFLDTLR